jgi:hypothetical protein
MTDHIAYFACCYIEDESPTEEEMREKLKSLHIRPGIV